MKLWLAGLCLGLAGSLLCSQLRGEVFQIQIGDTVSTNSPMAGAGRLVDASQIHVFTFPGQRGRSVYLQWLEGSALVAWHLFSPSGSQLAGFPQPGNSGRVELPESGIYQLWVQAPEPYPQLGTYSFKLLEVRESTYDVNLGDTVSGTVEAFGNYSLYRFYAPAGQLIYYEPLSSTRLKLELFDNSGMSLVSSPMDLPERIELRQAGYYTFRVSAAEYPPALGAYEFKLWAGKRDVIELSFGQTVSEDYPAAGAGKIEVPGSADEYTFSAVAGQVIYLQRLGSSTGLQSNLDWVVYDVEGKLVRAGAFDFDLDRVELAESGTYRIRLEARGTATGTYSFRVSEVHDQEFTIDLGTAPQPLLESGSIDQAGVHVVYNVAARAGEPFYVDWIAPAPPSKISVSLTAPDGKPLYLTGQYPDPGWIIPAETGTYQLHFQALNTNTGSYQFEVLSPQVVPVEITLGQTIAPDVPTPGAGTITDPHSVQNYEFEGNAGQVVYLQPLQTPARPSFYWEIHGPDGQLEAGSVLTLRGARVRLSAAGKHQLFVYASDGQSTGTFSLKLWAVPDRTFAIPFDQVVSEDVPGPGAGKVDQPGVQSVYTFEGTKGQFIYLQSLAASPASALSWQLDGPEGNLLFPRFMQEDLGRIELPQTGTYRVIVKANDDIRTGSFSFVVHGGTDQSFELPLDQTVSENSPMPGAGRIEKIGERDIYTFTAKAGDAFYFQGLGSSLSATFYWDLQDPSGVTLGAGHFVERDIGRVMLRQTGNYRIVVYSSRGSDLGTYSFKVWRVRVDQFQVLAGQVVSADSPLSGAGQIEERWTYDVYTYAGTAGQNISLHWLAQPASSTLVWAFIAPSGQALAGGWTGQDLALTRLDETGPYQLQVYAIDSVSTDSYSFRLDLNHPPVANEDSLVAALGKPLSFPVAKLLANDLDPDGDPLVFQPNALSEANGAVTCYGGVITYTPPPFTGLDFLSYTLRDGKGGVAQGTVTIAVLAAEPPPSQMLSLTRFSETGIFLHQSGVPGSDYLVESSEDLVSWTVLGHATVDSNGVWEFVHTIQLGSVLGFYRVTPH